MARDPARTEPVFALSRHESGTQPKGRWVLERGAERIPLPAGESVIGRGADVDIGLLDAHAYRIAGDAFLDRDLGRRPGTFK